MLKTSILAATAQILSICSLFLTFRWTSLEVGTELIGLWSLIQAVLTFARIGEAGVGTNLTRQVALRNKVADRLHSLHHTLAGLIQVSVPIILISAALYYPAAYIVERISPDHLRSHVSLFIVWAAGSAILVSASAITAAVSDGTGNLTLRHKVSIFGALLTIVAGPWIANEAGAAALPILPAITPSLLLFACVTQQLRADKSKRFALTKLPETIVATSRDNVALLGLALLRLAFEPLTKFSLGASGSYTSIAAFDLALKGSLAFRMVVQSATQPLLYYATREKGQVLTPEVCSRFSSAHNSIKKSSLLIGLILILLGPTIGLIALPTISNQFYVFHTLLTVSAAINTLGLAAYYHQVAAGEYSTITRVHITMLVLNIALAIAMRFVFGDIGVVAAYSVTFAYGGWRLSRSLALVQPASSSLGKQYIILLASLSCATAYFVYVVSAGVAFRSASVGVFLVIAICVPAAYFVLGQFRRNIP